MSEAIKSLIILKGNLSYVLNKHKKLYVYKVSYCDKGEMKDKKYLGDVQGSSVLGVNYPRRILSGYNYLGAIFLRGIVQEQLAGGNCLGPIVREATALVGNCPGRNCQGGNCPRWSSCLGGNCLGAIVQNGIVLFPLGTAACAF